MLHITLYTNIAERNRVDKTDYLSTLGSITGNLRERTSVVNPDVVIGVGGYVTVPVIMAAHSLKIKTFIHEQNSVAGKVNLGLSKIVDLIGVSFKSSIKEFPKNKTIFLKTFDF